MASIILTAAGTALGGALPGIGFLAGPVLGSIGGGLGTQVDGALGLSNTISGRQLQSIRLQESREGATIPRVYGTMRMAGNVIWASNLIETARTERVGGGKGGSARATTFSYSAHVAVGVCAGPVAAIHRIWADSKLIYDRATNGTYADAVRVYTGSATQTPDALIEGFVGTGNAPAYRGTAYVVFENLRLEHYGNRIPNLTFEVEGFAAGYAPAALGSVVHGAFDSGVTSNPRRALAINRTHVVVPGVEILSAGAQFRFVVEHYGWNGSAFTQTARTVSATYTSGGTRDPNFALSPDKTRICLSYAYLSDATLALYDVNARTFGAAFSPVIDPAALLKRGEIMWADNTTVLMAASGSDTLGVVPLQTGSTAITAPNPAPYTPVFADATLIDFVPIKAPLYSLGTLVLAATDFGRTTLAAARVTYANSGMRVRVLPTVTLPAGGGELNMVPLPGGSFVLSQTLSTNTVFSSYAIGNSGLSLTRGPSSIALAGATMTDMIVTSPDRLAVITGHNPYRMAEIQMGTSAFTLSGAISTISGAPTNDGSNAYISALAGNVLLLMTNTQVIAVTIRRGDNTLAAVVDDIGAQAGLSPALLNTSGLVGTRVTGFIISERQSARRAIETLQAVYMFSVVESDGVLVANLLTSGSATALPATALRASDDGAVPPAITFDRAQAQDIPTAVQIDYVDASADYAVASVVAARPIANPAAPPHRQVETIGLPIALDATVAQDIANRTLARRVLEGESIAITVARDWLALDTADRIICNAATWRITRHTVAGSLLRLQAVRDDATLLAPAGGTVPAPDATDSIIPFANLYAFDLPALTDAADQPGLYVGALAAAGWLGGVVYRTLDDAPAIEYTRLAQPLILGHATGVLATAATDYTDTANTVTIALATGTLSSVTELEALSGANMALLGDEIIHFQTATLVGSGIYTLSNLIRGRLGTESATTTHTAGERFVLLSGGGLQFVPATLADRNRSANLQLLSSGQTLAESLPVPITYGLRTLQPLAPVNISGMRDDTTNDVTFTWMRRARVQREWADGIDVPLDEDSELYTLDVMDSGGVNVLRTFTPNTPMQTYTAAQQTADFGSIPASIIIRLVQISAQYGAGQTATATITF
jgi:hypothetical protein